MLKTLVITVLIASNPSLLESFRGTITGSLCFFTRTLAGGGCLVAIHLQFYPALGIYPDIPAPVTGDILHALLYMQQYPH